MNNRKLLPIFLFFMGIITMYYYAFKPSDKLYEVKWNEPDTSLAITINGEISTTFPETSGFIGSVNCTSGTGKVEWNGTKWILTTNNITSGNSKCNITFSVQTLSDKILADNPVVSPITTPGQETSGYTLDDVTETTTVTVESKYQDYYVTYGTRWGLRASNFDLAGVDITESSYEYSYSDLVGKYLPHPSIKSSGKEESNYLVNTNNLSAVYYIVSATKNSFTYKELTSNTNETEALLASTEDDYGTSYYFRGAVKNNYVQFANKCWRIVRITGDGSVKLVLHNDNTSNVSNPCSSANNSDDSAFAHYNGSTYTSAFNTTNTDNTYIGFMYGTAKSSDYASTHANTNKSTILTNLETWYKNNLTSYEDKLADVIWCNDKSTRSSDLGYGTDSSSYAADARVGNYDGQYAAPSLICPNDNDGGKLSKFTVEDTANGNGSLTYKIGLLTIDEMMFSGARSARGNNTIYLQENAGDNLYWTLSPNSFSSGTTSVALTESGSLGTGDTSNAKIALRPSIALKSSISLSSGSGTSEDPYVIN